MSITNFDIFLFTQKIFHFGAWVKYCVRFFKDHYSFELPKRNKDLVNLKKSDKCYIIGLGPSLKGVDYTKLDSDTFVVNRFYKIGREWKGFTPTYYVLADKGFMDPENEKDFINLINEYKGGETKYLFNYSYAKSPITQSLDNRQKYFFSAFKGKFFHNSKIQIDRIMPSFGNVICNAIGIAMGLGYKEIILLGCDFNSFASRHSIHCYDEPSERGIRLDFELFCYSGDAYSHMELQEYAKAHGVKIINSTKGSLIDAYPYIIDENLYY